MLTPLAAEVCADSAPALARPVVDALLSLARPELSPDRQARADDLLAGLHRAVGVRYRLAWPIDWRHNPSPDHEWLIEHHKMPVLIDLALCWTATREPRWLQAWCELLDSWLTTMGTGELRSSDAQVEAKRIEHWLLSLAVLQQAGADGLPARLIHRLHGRLRDEAAYVLAHLRPSRNHRTFQLLSVWLVAVALPADPSSQDWRERSQALLCANLLDDFGADGVHIELSSHYHQITLEAAMAFALTADAVGVPLPTALEQRLRAALRHSAWLQLPDGDMPLMNDADAGDHRRLLAAGARRHGDAALAWLASAGQQGKAPPERSAWFAQAGYLFSRSDWAIGHAASPTSQHLFADFGELGAGSHAHYDLFNVCLSIGGRQVLVDPGRYTYHAEPDAEGIDWRHAFKRTAAHNTVEIDGRNQTRYLSKARQPAAGLERLDRSRHIGKHGPAVVATDRRVMTGRRSDWACATALSHEYTPRHTRLVLHAQRRLLLLIDHVAADDGQAHQAVLNLHLAADWLDRTAVSRCPTERPVWTAAAQGWRLHLACDSAQPLEHQPGWVSRSYGIKEAAPVLRLATPFVDRAWFVSVLAADTADEAVDAVDAWRVGDQVHVRVTGHDRLGAWVDQTVLACGAQPLAFDTLAPDCGSGHARLLHRRRRGEAGVLDHLVIGDAAADLSLRLAADRPLHRHAGGHLET
ncbi:alginate lyase family protein [Sphaerotilus mobilis]|uniref:Heparinase II/III-like protein n=1 Tax=Sphaerotilus mobilis TaxID=47994 RepID=A0A4Q7LPX6_9BURK|nr:alginate lyase family protein [Sphaerotilus mobilis]RZS56826.1 heparinase II/III-like protein [Sphaerotilus mobilis]